MVVPERQPPFRGDLEPRVDRLTEMLGLEAREPSVNQAEKPKTRRRSNSAKVLPNSDGKRRRSGHAGPVALGRKLHWEIARLLAAQDAIDIGGSATQDV